MDDRLERYLEIVYRNLRPLAISERTDIINEIKSHIQENQIKQQMDVNTMLENLGDPVKLGKAYAGESITKNTQFNFSNIIRIILFYSLTGFSGIFVVLFLSILSVALYICAFITAIAGAIKTVGTLAGMDVPFVQIDFGFWQPHGLLALPISLLFAILFYLLSKKLWRFLRGYLAAVTEKHQNFINDVME